MDRAAWRATVHGVARSQTWLSDWVRMHTHTHTHTSSWNIVSNTENLDYIHPRQGIAIQQGSMQLIKNRLLLPSVLAKFPWFVFSAAIHGVAKSRTRLSDWTELNWTEHKHDKYWKSYLKTKYVIYSRLSFMVPQWSFLPKGPLRFSLGLFSGYFLFHDAKMNGIYSPIRFPIYISIQLI